MDYLIKGVTEEVVPLVICPGCDNGSCDLCNPPYSCPRFCSQFNPNPGPCCGGHSRVMF